MKGEALMQVKGMMTVDPECCTSDTPLPDVARMMVQNDCGEIPVVDNKSSKVPVGVITDRDIVCRTVATGLNPLDLTAGDCMSSPIVTVKPETTMEECCRILEEKQIRRVPVVNDRGSCVGILAVADVALHTGRNVAGHIVTQISEPTASSSAARG